jgi:hypothetical protein
MNRSVFLNRGNRSSHVRFWEPCLGGCSRRHARTHTHLRCVVCLCVPTWSMAPSPPRKWTCCFVSGPDCGYLWKSHASSCGRISAAYYIVIYFCVVSTAISDSVEWWSPEPLTISAAIWSAAAYAISITLLINFPSYTFIILCLLIYFLANQ